MPLDTGLLYGEMVGAWILHFAIPFGVSMLLPALFPLVKGFMQLLLFIGICMLFSGILQIGLLAFLQSASCGGVKDYSSILGGAFWASLLFAGMIAIPIFIEPMRLLFSQLLVHHYPLLTPELEQLTASIVATATGVKCDAATTKSATKAGLSQHEYDLQTFQEIAFGASYWGAFGGTYGLGIGSFMSSRCLPSA